MNFDFDHCPDRRDGDSLKWNRYGQTDILPMWVADMDFVSPPAVIDALHQRVTHGIFGYVQPPPELNQVVMNWLSEHYDWQIEEDWLVWLPGLRPALHCCCHAAAAAGDEVITFTPAYPPFLTAPITSGRQTVAIPLKRQNNRYTFDLEALEQRLGPRSRLLMLCNPHNPVGRSFDREELTQLKELCLRHQLIVCSDEIHCDLLLTQRRHLPFASIDSNLLENTITLMSPAKTFNLSGLNCGFAVIANAALRRRFIKARQGLMPSPNALGYVAALAAYRHGEPWRQQLIDYLRGNHRLLQHFFSQHVPQFHLDEVEATYLAWIKNKTGKTQNGSRFEQAGVGVYDGEEFGDSRYVRLNFGCPRDQLRLALERLEHRLN